MSYGYSAGSRRQNLPARAHLPRLRLPLSIHGGRRRALVPGARRAAGAGRPRDHVSDPAPVAARRRADHPRRGRARSRAQARSLRQWEAADRSRSPLRPRRPRPPAQTRTAVRRRPLCVDAVLRATRGGGRAFTFAHLHERRLRAEGFRGPIQVVGVYVGPLERPDPAPAEPVVVYVGRHIPEKGVLALPAALAHARKSLPDLRGEILGDGPLRAEVEQRVRDAGLDGVVSVPGFVGEDEVRDAVRRALCLALPSTREGYGLVVIEASSLGTPSVVVTHPDNAALELVEDGVNGVVASSAEPADVAAAFLRAHEAGEALRESTADWFDQ